jgi:hypothetical protein
MTAKRMHEPLSAAATTLPGFTRTREPAVVAADPTPTASELDALDVAPTHQLEGIELRSLASFAALFYGAAFVALGVGIAVVWILASIAGLVGRFEEFMQSIGFRDFQVIGPKVILGGLLLAAALVVFLTVMTVLAGALFNVMANSGRTVRVRLGEAPPAAPGPPPERVMGESAPRALMRALRRPRDPSSTIAAMDGGGIPAH